MKSFQIISGDGQQNRNFVTCSIACAVLCIRPDTCTNIVENRKKRQHDHLHLQTQVAAHSAAEHCAPAATSNEM